MKKIKNLFLIAVVCLTGVLFTDKVFAAVVVEYPVYSGKIIYAKNRNRICTNVYGDCKEYSVSEDDGINDDRIKLTDTDGDTFEVKKSWFSIFICCKFNKKYRFRFTNSWRRFW